MTPFTLLSIFLAVAVAAFIGFAVLAARRDASPAYDDWKKFLGSFSGTALALSVGFISLIVQQHNQATQRRDEENGQIRARLLYSVALVGQNHDALDIYLSGPWAPKTTNACDPTKTQEQREEQLQIIRTAYAAPRFQLYLGILKQFILSDAYDRNVTIRLMKETNLPSRIHQQLMADLLGIELRLIATSSQLVKAVEMGNNQTVETFCEQLGSLEEIWQLEQDSTALFRLETCAVYAVINLPDAESLDRTGIAWQGISQFIVPPGKEAKTSNEAHFRKLTEFLGRVVGANNRDFTTCLTFSPRNATSRAD